MSVYIGGKHVPPSPGQGAVATSGLHITQSSTSLLAEAPALSRADWIPEGAFPELDELRTEHQGLRDQALAADRDASALKERFEAEDASHAEALRARVSDPSLEHPDLSSPEDRAAAVAEAEGRSRAVAEVQDAFLHRAVATIAERYPEWVAMLDSQDGEVEDRVEEARAALAKLEAQRDATVQLRLWLQRTAGHHPRFGVLDGRHIAYPDLAGVGRESTRTPAQDPGSAVEAETETGPVPVSPMGRAQQLAERASQFNLDGGDSNA